MGPVLTSLVATAIAVGGLAGGSSTAAGPSGGGGPWVWPLAPQPTVVHGYEPPPTPWAAGHRGVDLASSARQPVYAAGAGVVGFAGVIAGVPVVTVLHGGLRTTYEPVVATRRPGARVAAGDVIGRLVTTGSHCAPRPCLHWGLLRGRAYLDPLSLLGRARLRLLPLSGAGPPPAGMPWGDS